MELERNYLPGAIGLEDNQNKLLLFFTVVNKIPLSVSGCCNDTGGSMHAIVAYPYYHPILSFFIVNGINFKYQP